VARALAVVAGAALPLVLLRVRAGNPTSIGFELGLAALLAVALARWQARTDGWRVGVILLLLFFIYTVVR
jgi:hypothetical protein